jgi:acetoin utilization protein AcuB
MIISRVMTKNPVFVHPDMPVNDARALMDKENIGKLPVLDRDNRLVGIVTRKDMIKAGPSPATTLDMYEISYLLAKLKIEKIMERNVVTAGENEVVEEAARIMADKDISCLPVMRNFPDGKGGLLVGIITGTDLFRVFVNAFGARHPGIRVTLNMTEKPGQLARFAGSIAERGGNIVAFVSSEGDDLAHRRGTLKIAGLSKKDVEEIALSLSGAELEDIRE